MSGEEWDDEEADYYPSAPLPPHERVWRHPSELGQPVAVTAAPPTFGRLALVGAGVVSVILVVGLVQLLAPRSGISVVSSQATQALIPRPTLADPGRSLASAASTLRGQISGAVRTTAAVRTSAPASTRRPQPTNAVATIMLSGTGTGSRRAAVPVGNGDRAVTTAGTLTEDDTIDVRLADGTSMSAVVITVDASANVAVLALEERAVGATPEMAARSPHDGDVVFVGCDELEVGVLVETDTGMVVDLAAAADEGAPVLDQDGALVGLASNGDDGAVHLVPVSDALAASAASEEAATDDTESDDGAAPPTTVLMIDVWLGVTFGGDDLVIDVVQTAAPAEAAGLLVGDRLVLFDTTSVATVDDVWAALAVYDPGDMVTLVVERDGAQVTLVVTLGARPS